MGSGVNANKWTVGVGLILAIDLLHLVHGRYIAISWSPGSCLMLALGHIQQTCLGASFLAVLLKWH